MRNDAVENDFIEEDLAAIGIKGIVIETCLICLKVWGIQLLSKAKERTVQKKTEATNQDRPPVKIPALQPSGSGHQARCPACRG